MERDSTGPRVHRPALAGIAADAAMAHRPPAAPSYAVPPADFTPPPARVVRVWLLSLDAPPVPAAQLRSWLAPEERERAARFVFPDDRARWQVARGLLRVALANALDLEPSALRLVHGVNGRPTLDTEAAARGVAFNLSHSGDRLAIAIARAPTAPVAPAAPLLGVDIEQLRPVPEMIGVARRVFTPVERQALMSAGDADRVAVFHRLWTRKEACLKATGAGFTLAADGFEVDAGAAVQRVRLPSHECAPAGAELVVHALPVVGDCAGAVAVAGEGWDLDVRAIG